MPKVLRTLIICSLLIVGATAPAVAAGHSHTASVTAHGGHTNGTPDGHIP
jgi:Spy/CpxP family protein refolding chaperone